MPVVERGDPAGVVRGRGFRPEHPLSDESDGTHQEDGATVLPGEQGARPFQHTATVTISATTITTMMIRRLVAPLISCPFLNVSSRCQFSI